ncbi:MAG TPA: DUF1961 family protein [Candidatus Brocadiia bacterium]|nr:DUF1961 family protein [Candidatus Brocadiia bacterium]
MPVEYPNKELLHSDDFADFAKWHHEGIGEIARAPAGGMRLVCSGSRQGGRGCMAFFRPTLPDLIAVEYDIVVHRQGGLVINYIAIRGLNGEDMIEDAARLPAREGIMANYWAKYYGLQSYHVSFSRFNDKGEHTQTSNWRRNPGCLLAGHGVDKCAQIGRKYHIRLVKDKGHLQLYVNGEFAHGMIDRDTTRYPIPDTGKFGFRLIGSDVMADVESFKAWRVESDAGVWSNGEDWMPPGK